MSTFIILRTDSHEQQLKDLRGALAEAKRYYATGTRYYDSKHRTYHCASYAENILQHVSDLVGYHGVEAFDPEDSNPTHPKYLYVNSGDTYCLTLIFNAHSNRFLFSDIGSIIEREQLITVGGE